MFHPTQLGGVLVALVSLIAGVLFTAGTALSLKPQLSACSAASGR